MATGASEHAPGMGTYVGIWVGFLAIVGIEVFITYQRPETKHLLFTLLILAAIEALVLSEIAAKRTPARSARSIYS